MVGRRRDCIGPLRNHAGTRDIPNNLAAWQVAAYSRLGSLPHFNFNRSGRLQICLMYAESPGSYLYNRIGSITVKILMQSALSCIVIRSEPFRSARKAFMRVFRNGSIGHCRKHHWCTECELRRQAALKLPIFVTGHFMRLLP